MITFLPTGIKILFKKDIQLNVLLKYKIFAIQPTDFSHEYKKATSYTDMLYIGCNFC